MTYWKDNTVTLAWKDFKDTKHGDVNDITKTLLELIEPLDKFSVIMELGCGQGRNLKALDDEGYIFVNGVEINKENIQQAHIDYLTARYRIVEADIHDYISKSEVIDCFFTTACAYLLPEETVKLIQERCEYYIAIEPSDKTYFTPGDEKYNRYDYKKILDKMDCVREVNCKWDNYKGYLFKKR